MPIHLKSEMVERVIAEDAQALADLEEKINKALEIGFTGGAKCIEIDLSHGLHDRVQNEIRDRCRAAGYEAYINTGNQREPCFKLVIKWVIR